MTAMTQTERVERRFGRPDAWDKTRFTEADWKNWRRTGRIPEKNWLGLLIDARACGADLTPYDFVAHVADAYSAHVDAGGNRTSDRVSASPAQPA